MTQIVVPIMLTDTIFQIDTERYQFADLIEWRVDFAKKANIASIGKQLKQAFKKPLIFTIRTAKEGGNYTVNSSEYLSLLQELIAIQPEYLDFEYFSYPDIFEDVKKNCQENNIKLLLSFHNFEEVPVDIEARLKTMIEKKPAVAKFAVMPHDFSDVLKVLNLTTAYSEQKAVKIVTMAMGELGKISRVTGNLTGSAWTFAAIEESSAPGQLSLVQTKELLNEFKGNNND